MLFLRVKTKECIEPVNCNNPIILRACIQGFRISNCQGSWYLITFYYLHMIVLFCLSFLEHTFMLFLKLPGRPQITKELCLSTVMKDGINRSSLKLKYRFNLVFMLGFCVSLPFDNHVIYFVFISFSLRVIQRIINASLTAWAAFQVILLIFTPMIRKSRKFALSFLLLGAWSKLTFKTNSH